MSDTTTTLAEFARRLGISAEGVRKAIKSGRIPEHMVGSRELLTGRRVPCILDVDGALAAFAANTDPAYRHITNARAGGVADSAGDIPSSGVSRQMWEHYRALRARVDFVEQAESLAAATDVAQVIFEEYEFTRKVLMTIPAKVAESVAASADAKQIRTILEDAIRDALDDLTSDIDEFYESDISGIEPNTSTSN